MEQLKTRLVPATYLYNSTTKLLKAELASGESAGLQSSNYLADQVSIAIFGGTFNKGFQRTDNNILTFRSIQYTAGPLLALGLATPAAYPVLYSRIVKPALK